MLAVLDVLGQDHQRGVSLRRADEHDGLDDGFAEFDIPIFLEAIGQELQENGSLARNTLIQ